MTFNFLFFLHLVLLFIALADIIKASCNGQPRKKRTAKSSLDFSSGSDSDDEPTKTDSNGKTIPVNNLYIPSDYNKYEIPSNSESLGLNPSAMIVRVHIRIREIGDLDEMNERITVTLDVRLWWTDSQIFKANQDKIHAEGGDEGINIRFKREQPTKSPFGDFQRKPKKLDPSFIKKIWKPDLFMESLVESIRPEFIAQPIRFEFWEDGTLVLQSRFTLTLSCNMDFHYYPADTQECDFNIRSYNFDNSEMELEWGHPEPSVYAYDRRNTNFEVQVSQPVLTNFTEPSLDASNGISISFNGVALDIPKQNETFDILAFSIKARRKMSYHLIQTYLPSGFFIVITWLCFFIPPAMVECRIGIAMTTLLTLTAMFASVRESAPIVSYWKAIDLWMIACIVFVFLILLEFSLLVWLGLTKESENDANSRDVQPEEFQNNKEEEFELRVLRTRNGDEVEHIQGAKIRPWIRWWRQRKQFHPRGAEAGKNFEAIAVPCYLLSFVVFNLIYWSWLLGSSDYFNWTIDATYNAVEEESLK